MTKVLFFGLLHHKKEGGARWSKVEQNSLRKRCSTTTRPRRGWGWSAGRGRATLKVEQL